MIILAKLEWFVVCEWRLRPQRQYLSQYLVTDLYNLLLLKHSKTADRSLFKALLTFGVGVTNLGHRMYTDDLTSDRRRIPFWSEIGKPRLS